MQSTDEAYCTTNWEQHGEREFATNTLKLRAAESRIRCQQATLDKKPKGSGSSSTTEVADGAAIQATQIRVDKYTTPPGTALYRKTKSEV